MQNRARFPALGHPEAPLGILLMFHLGWFSVVLPGCGAPGDPTPRRPKVPMAVTDLAAHQTGDAVVLTFSLPKNSTEGDPLNEPLVIEILRGSEAAAAGGKRPPQLIYTIPGGSVDTYAVNGRVQFPDPLKPEDVSAGGEFMYLVRTRLSGKRASAESNTVPVRFLATPEPITDVRARVTETAVELSWSPPERTATGAKLEGLTGYKIYRAELEPGVEPPGRNELARAKLKSPLEPVGPSSTSSFRDTHFEFGRTYLYSVRSTVQYGSDSADSLDSEPVVLTPQDTFPPGTPKSLVAVVVPATSDVPARVELSWGISPESDLAGYRVYRSEQAETVGERINRELLPSPTFRDISVTPGHRYTYRVTAVDQAGNESLPSDAASVDVAPGAPQ